MKKVAKVGCILISITFLAACTNVAMTGVQAVYNRHSLQKNFNDQLVTMKAYKALNRDTDQFKHTNIAVATFNNEILLTGQVPELYQKLKAEERIKAIPNIDHVYNFLTIANPSSTLTGISDAWITSKVKTKLMASSDVDATRVKVVTEDGTVYLMGVLQPREADAAVDIASTTDGVVSVVKIFTYMKIYKA